MNRLAAIDQPRAVPFRATEFHAFRVCQGVERLKDVPLGGRTYALGELDAVTLEEAVSEAVSSTGMLGHKEHLLIRETGERGVKLHLFAIKRKASPRYVWEGHQQKRVHDLYAAPVCTIDAGVIG